MPSSRQVRMTRTAISPRLAMRTLFSMVALWLAHRLAGAPIRGARLHQPLAARPGEGRGARRAGGHRRPPDRREGPAGAHMGGAAGREPADERAAAARPAA